jgi:Cys-tRNA(Pro) deacylase
MARTTVHVSETPATQWLKRHGVAYTGHPYDYVDHGGTAVCAQALGVPEHQVVKTLVMQDEDARPLLVLMHGDRTVSTRQLARDSGHRHVEPCRADVAERHTGYRVGGISPFGTRKVLPVFVERTVLALPMILINGGRRGFLVGVDPAALTGPLGAVPVACGLPP